MNQHYTNAVTVLQGVDSNPWVVTGSITTSPDVNIHDSAGNSLGSTSGSLNTNVTNAVSVLQSGTWNINNISGTISLPTGAATESTLSTLSGKVPSGLTVTSTRLLVDGSGVTQPVSGTITADIGSTGGLALDSSLTTINSTLGSPFQAGGLIGNTSFGVTQGTTPWVVSGTISPSITSDRIVTGSITALNQTIPISTEGCGAVTIQLSGSGFATITFEQLSGSDWLPLYPVNVRELPAIIYETDNSLDTTGLWQANCAGISQIRVNCTSYTSGSIDVVLEASIGAARDITFSPSSSLTVAQGQATSAPGAWPVKITDGSATVGVTSTRLNTSAAQSGAWSVGVNNFPATQPVSGTVGVTQTTTPWVVGQSTPSALNATVIGTGTFAVQATLAPETTKVIGTVNQGTSPWVTSFSAPQHVINDASSAVIGHVISDTGSTTAVTGNVTVVQPTGTNLHVVVDTAPSTAVTNAGTFAVQATLTAETTKVIGTVNANAGTNLNTSLLTLDATSAKLNLTQASTTLGQTGPLIQGAVTTSPPTYTTAQSNPVSLTTAGGLRTDTSTVAGNTILTGNGTTGTGSQRVTIASDNTAFSVNATLSAETTKVIGTVRLADGAGTLLTTTSSNLDINTKSINGVTPLMGNGTTGTGSQRVTIASDNTAFTVNAAQSGTWTVQPGNTANTTPWLVDTATSTGKAIVGKTGNLVTTAVTADQVIVTYTVTALKTFYLEQVDLVVRLTTFATTATQFGTFSLETPSGTKIYTQIPAGAGVNNQIVLNFSGDPIPISAGTVVRLVCTPSATTSFTWQGNMIGFEK